MILLAAVFLAGDAWSWDVTLQYLDPTDGYVQKERERWSVRIEAKSAFKAERLFLGSFVEGGLIPATDARPEILKGTIEPDGTLQTKENWSDPSANKALRQLLNPDQKLKDRVAEWPVVRRATLRDLEARLPGSEIPVRLTVTVSLSKARLGGQDIELLPTKGQGL